MSVWIRSIQHYEFNVVFSDFNPGDVAHIISESNEQLAMNDTSESEDEMVKQYLKGRPIRTPNKNLINKK